MIVLSLIGKLIDEIDEPIRQIAVTVHQPFILQNGDLSEFYGVVKENGRIAQRKHPPQILIQLIIPLQDKFITNAMAAVSHPLMHTLDGQPHVVDPHKIKTNRKAVSLGLPDLLDNGSSRQGG